MSPKFTDPYSDRYSLLPDGSLLDTAGFKTGDSALVCNPGTGWTTFRGTLGEITDSKPVLKSEVSAIIDRLISSRS
jgi:hypothetical protein